MWRVIFLCTLYILPSHGKSTSIQILGLFSLTNCDPNLQHECENALLNEQQMRRHHKEYQFDEDVELCTIDISNDHKKMITILLTLREVDHILCRDENSFRVDSLRVVIFTYMSFHLTKFASSIVLPSNQALLVSVTDRPMYPAYYVDHPLSIYSYETSFGVETHKNSLMKIKNELGVSYAACLKIENSKQNLGDGNETLACSNEDKSAMCVYTQANPSDCYKQKTIDVNNITQIENVKFQLAHDEFAFVLLSGERQLLQTFEDKFGTTPFVADKFLLMWYVTKTTTKAQPKKPTDYYKADVLLNFLGAFAINKILYYITHLSTIIRRDPDIWNLLLKNQGVQKLLQDLSKRYCYFIRSSGLKYKCGDEITENDIKEFKKFSIVFNVFLREITKSLDFYKVVIRFFQKRNYINNIDIKQLFNQTIWNPENALKSSPVCNDKKPNCSAGTELVHSFYKQINWTRNFGWNCKKCDSGYFKAISGNNANCSKCSYPYTTNKNQTSCYDPFRIAYVNMSDVSAKIIVVFSSLMFVSIIVTALTFAKYRNTPVVMSANRKMTSLQLFGHTVLTLVPICTCIIYPSKQLCIANEVLIGFSFSITTSVNISKTQKLFMIFDKKVVMNKSEILFTKASEWLTVILILFLNVFTHITIMITGVITSLKYHNNLLEKEIYCSNLDGVYIQILFAAILIFLNGIQGFRARKLPSRFRETNHVIYSSFASMVVYISTSAIYFNEIKETNRLMILMTSVLLINIINFSLLYYYKVYLIIFKPEMNTKKAFNEKRLQKMGHDNHGMANNL